MEWPEWVRACVVILSDVDVAPEVDLVRCVIKRLTSRLDLTVGRLCLEEVSLSVEDRVVALRGERRQGCSHVA